MSDKILTYCRVGNKDQLMEQEETLDQKRGESNET